jgi:hypothetical protein
MKSLWRLAAVAMGVVVSTGCGISEDHFYDKVRKIGCERAFECEPEDAQAQWANEDACVDAFSDAVGDARVAKLGCTYKRKKARKYLRAYKRIDCEAAASELEELEAKLEAVYECPGDSVSAADETGDTGSVL